MGTPPLSDDLAIEAVETLREVGNKSGAARKLNIPRQTFISRLEVAALRGLGIPEKLRATVPPANPGFSVPPLPSPDLPIAELVEHRKRLFALKKTAKTARKLIQIQIKVDGPIGIMHGGDPHVDDDGTDLELLERHTALCSSTDGMFGANVGDLQNNWIGRLARLYAQQSTSHSDAWRLVEWYCSRMRFLYLISGNHDAWSGEGDPLKWIMSAHDSVHEAHGARMNLNFPNGKSIRVNARHDFKGHSMWNTAHGPAKAAQMGWRDHILTCGHTHTSGYQVLKDPASGLISHALRVASYKTMDRYADELGLPDQNIFLAPVTVIDPQYADDDARLITTIFDPEEGAEYLTWKRGKWASQKRAA